MNGAILNTKPKKWIAAVLGIFAAPLAYLYVDAPRWAAASLVVGLAVGLAGYFMPGLQSNLAFSAISILLAVAWASLAYQMAGKKTGDESRPWYSRWYGLVCTTAIAIMIILVIRVFFYEPFRAPSSSMMPGVPRGANVMVQKWGYGHYSTVGMVFGSSAISAPLERGDIVVFDYPRDPSQTYIKRIVGLPGDKVVYRDKRVFVNGVDVRGKQLDDFLDDQNLRYSNRYQEKLGRIEHDILINPNAPSIYSESVSMLPSQCALDHDVITCNIPAGNYFVMGDNRDNSLDSRYWGFVAAKAIIGKVVRIVPG
jgi:signal peptidase I